MLPSFGSSVRREFGRASDRPKGLCEPLTTNRRLRRAFRVFRYLTREWRSVSRTRKRVAARCGGREVAWNERVDPVESAFEAPAVRS
jgi:hypothetical protein